MRMRVALGIGLFCAAIVFLLLVSLKSERTSGDLTVSTAVAYDESPPLSEMTSFAPLEPRAVFAPPNSLSPQNSASVSVRVSVAVDARSRLIEQTEMGSGEAPHIAASFDGLGVGFSGPQGVVPDSVSLRNPSDNSLAVGPNHIVQIVNSRMAIFTKKGDVFGETGRVLYGPAETRHVFSGFGGACDERNNGDTVVLYDQLADRWLIVMPIFSRIRPREDEPAARKDGDPARESMIGQKLQPGRAKKLQHPTKDELYVRDSIRTEQRAARRLSEGGFAMCYALSTSPDPFGSYYRYEFVRLLFPDYPRPAVWPDGYYVPTSTGDDIIEKHACVVDRHAMLMGEMATEQCLIINDVNFLNNAGVDGFETPDRGAPNIIMATGGSQLNGVLEDDGIYAWKFFVNWRDASKTRLEGPEKIMVTPYHYLCGGQLKECVPQPGTDQRLDSQGDKIMARLVYRRRGDVQSIVAVHSVNTAAGAGGVRWYEFRINDGGDIELYQEGTYAPEGQYRWMASPAMDKNGNIGIGYSFGGLPDYPGQRFAGRLDGDPLGELTLREAVLVEGEESQKNTLRWEDYTQTAVDPSDDCTIWYVGDYLKAGAEHYSTRIGAFQMAGCGSRD